MTSTALAGYKAGVFITSSPSSSVGTLAMTDSGDHQTFNASNAAKQCFDDSVSFTVQAKRDEVQSVTLTGGPTGGTFTLTFGGHTTSTIAFNASAATVQADLIALSSIGSGNVSVSGSNGGPWTIEFIGALAYASQALITGSFGGLTGGTSPNGTIAEVQAGGGFGTISSSLYKIRYPIGQVVFNAPLLGTPNVQITAGNYFPFAFLAGAKEWDGTAQAVALETTVFTNPATPDKTFIGGLASATVKLMQLWLDPGMIGFLVPGVRVVLLLHTGANSNSRFQGYVIMSKTDIKSAVAAVNTEDTDWVVTGQFFYIAS